MVGRTDKTTDPHLLADLLMARRGQAYFSRAVRLLSDRDFDSDSLVAGWSRRHVVGHVGLNARALTRLTTWAATGIETPMYASGSQREEEIELAATLPVQALRNLSDHAAIHLNVEWRDLEPHHWLSPVRTAQGREVAASETIWMRIREVWIHAVDLDNGRSFEEFPSELLDRLLLDVAQTWARRADPDDPGEQMVATDRPRADPGRGPTDAGSGRVVTGSAAALARWATGRGSQGVTDSHGHPAPEAPRWL